MYGSDYYDYAEEVNEEIASLYVASDAVSSLTGMVLKSFFFEIQ